MRLTPHALWLAWCLAGFGCLGGPTSDWPDKANEDGDPNTPPGGPNEGEDDGEPGHALDAGSSSSFDAGKPAAGGACRGDGGVEPADASDAGSAPDGSSTRVGPTSHSGDGGCP